MWGISLGLSLVAALLTEKVGWPLPWLIGPLLIMIIVRCAFNYHLVDIPCGRRVGQWLVATSIGLHFTPDVVEQVLLNFWVVVLAAVLTLGAALIGVSCLSRSGCDRATAFFSSLPGGASEMVNMAIQHGARVDQVAAAHSLRVVSIVLIVPPLFTWFLPVTQASVALPILWPQLILVLVLGLVLAAFWTKSKQPNPWMLGPLFAAGLYVSITGTYMSMPPVLAKSGQLLIGLSLGTYFDRGFIQSAFRFLGWVALFIVLSMLFCGVLALCLAWLSHLPTTAILLGMTPGGITELSITAEALHIPVALVTAIQVLRLVFVMFLAGPMFSYWMQREK